MDLLDRYEADTKTPFRSRATRFCAGRFIYVTNEGGACLSTAKRPKQSDALSEQVSATWSISLSLVKSLKC